MAKKGKVSFDPKRFLAKVGDGKTIAKYQPDQIVFSQGEPADAVFYIQKGKLKLTVISEQGKEAVVAIVLTYGSHAACLARKRARAFFPSLAASAMLSKKPGEHSTNPERPAR